MNEERSVVLPSGGAPAGLVPLPSSRVRVGVLGASRIVGKALTEVSSGLVEVVALAARSEDRAAEHAKALGIPRALGGYEALLELPEVDVVYIALPAALHAPWALRALRAGKHVLCEKPFALDLEQAKKVVSLAAERGLLVMEAQHWRYHPLAEAFLGAAVELAPLDALSARFDAGLPDPNDIRLDPALGAGVLLDFGCYLVQWCAAATGQDVLHFVGATCVRDERGVDVAAEVQLRAGAGTRVELGCDMRPGVPFVAEVRLSGPAGEVTFTNPLSLAGSRLTVAPQGGTPRVTSARGPSTYRRQLEALVSALRGGPLPPTAGAAILPSQAALDELRRCVLT